MPSTPPTISSRRAAQRLYAIGAASRQELEKLEAEKSEMDARVETARSRLVLLGIPEERTQRIASPADVVTTFDVKAPITGVITKRNANPGLNIDLGDARCSPSRTSPPCG